MTAPLMLPARGAMATHFGVCTCGKKTTHKTGLCLEHRTRKCARRACMKTTINGIYCIECRNMLKHRTKQEGMDE